MIITESGPLIFSPAFIRIGLPLQYAQMLIKMALELQPWQLYSKQDEERKAEKLKHVSQMSGYSSRVSEKSSQWMTASFLSWVIWGTSDSWSLAPQNMVFQFSSVQSLSRVWLFATPWTTERQASLSITNSRSPSKPTSIESVMPSNHLILCCPLLLLPSIFPSIKVVSNESALHIRWPKYWSFSFNISPSSEHPGLISFSL